MKKIFFAILFLLLGGFIFAAALSYAACPNNFPTSLNVWGTGACISSSWGNALETKIGINNSTDPTSLDWKTNNPNLTLASGTLASSHIATTSNYQWAGYSLFTGSTTFTGGLTSATTTLFAGSTTITGSTTISGTVLVTGNCVGCGVGWISTSTVLNPSSTIIADTPESEATAGNPFTKKKEIAISFSGAMAVTWDLASQSGSNQVCGQVWVNGTSTGIGGPIHCTSGAGYSGYTDYIGTTTARSIGDLVQLYLQGNFGTSAAQTNEFHITYYLVPSNLGTINMN